MTRASQRGARSDFWRPVIVCAMLAAATGPAAAFEIFGIRLFGSAPTVEADDFIGEPQFYEIEFRVTGDDTLEQRLRTASNLWVEREEAASGVAGLVSRARGDYRRLLAALYAEGHYGGSVSILIEGSEASVLQPDAALPPTATVLVTVDTGPVFRFGRAEIINEAPLPLDVRDEAPRPAEEGFAVGDVARSGAILRAERLAVEAWRRQGYAKAEIVERRVEALHDRGLVEAFITVDPGQPAYYGPVSVRGTERLDPEWLAWMTGLERGRRYHPDDLARAGTRLARLDVFRASRFEEAERIGPGGMLPIELIVQERLPRRIGVGGSFSTVDGLGAEAFWLHRNLFGRAERLRLDARVGGIGRGTDPRRWSYRLGAQFIRPGVYTPDTDFVAGVRGEREVLNLYTRTGVDAEAGFNHRFSDELSARAFVNASHARFEENGVRRDFTTTGLLGALAFDNRDDPANATSGFFLEAIVEPFYEFQFSNAAVRATGEARTYLALDTDDRIVLAGRARLGTLLGPPIAETPPNKLFLAGGGGSVRGYPFRSIGVEQDGQVMGGRSLIELSAEARVRASESIGVVGFVDAGYVGAGSVPDFSQRFRIGAGVGLRYQTGLGPIRLDVAMPLDRRPGDPRAAFYIGLGQAF